jgi:hypothetical protein
VQNSSPTAKPVQAAGSGGASSSVPDHSFDATDFAAGGRACNPRIAASAPMANTTSTAVRARGWRPTQVDDDRPFAGQSRGSRGQDRKRPATGFPRSGRPGSSATTECRRWRQAARSSARRRPSLRRARHRRQLAAWRLADAAEPVQDIYDHTYDRFGSD